MTYLRKVLVPIILAAAAVAAAAEMQTPAVRTFAGETKQVGNGVIRTWITLDQDDKPIAIGVTFTEGLLSGLPDTLPHTEYVLSLPPQASATPFTHFALNWNPQGHIPPGIYDAPHFDFHFYIISPQVRANITATGADLERVLKTPTADGLPPDYQTAPDAYEPRMGNHFVDMASPEFQGQPFTITFVYGYYEGALAFVEPMMTRAYLETQPFFTQPLKLPAAYPTPGYYPTRYALRYDPAHKRYILALQGLTLR